MSSKNTCAKCGCALAAGKYASKGLCGDCVAQADAPLSERMAAQARQKCKACGASFVPGPFSKAGMCAPCAEAAAQELDDVKRRIRENTRGRTTRERPERERPERRPRSYGDALMEEAREGSAATRSTDIRPTSTSWRRCPGAFRS
jgi:hypothetical protein